MHRVQRTWVVAESGGTTGTRRTTDELVEKLLHNRQIKDRERFFHPNFERDSHDPLLMPNMRLAVDRIQQALATKETVAVYCDYDADGIPGGALLIKVFRANGGTLVPYVPDREKEGYGLNAKALDYLKEQGVSLLITVDLGISNREQVSLAKKLGIEVVVTDHHHIEPDHLPTEAVAILHPALEGSKYPFQGLAGGGVAWKLAQALADTTGKPNRAQLKWWFELPALSTVCDIVPLLDENRMIVHYGLKVLQQTRNVGLKALYKAGGIAHDQIEEWTIGFQIGPRLNAPGRIDHAALSLELLLTDDEARAASIAATIELQNRERQEQLEVIVQEAASLIERDHLQEQPAIVLLGEKWAMGLIGLAAARIVERYHRPTLLLGKHADGIAKGSGRSIEGFNLLAGIQDQASLLTSYGGHEKAAGVQLKVEHFEQFQRQFVEFARAKLSDEDLVPKLRADAQIEPAQITDELVTEILRFRPFGPGNPRPKFVVTPLTIVEIRPVGADGSHLKLRFQEQGLEAIGFRMGQLAATFHAGDTVSALGSLEFNEWNGTERIQLKLDDLKPLNDYHS